MSILIKGMEMPKSCMNCMFCGFAGANCELDLCQITGNAQKHIAYSKMPDCPLIEISSDDVAPVVKARWVYTNMSRLVCSNCGNPVAFSLKEDGWHHGDFCPKCGAKMDLLN